MQKLSLFVAVAFLASLAPGETPLFRGPEMINDAGVPIDVGNYAAPEAYDWNLDGAKDLVLGQFSEGKIRLYLNLGPDTDPYFNGCTYYQSGGTDITLPYG